MSRFTEALKKVVKEKLQAKTNVAGVDLNFDDKGTLTAKGKIGSADVSANSKGDLYAKGDFGGGTMATAVNKDGDGGVAFTDRKGRTVSQTAGDRDAWVSAGPNQPSKRVSLNNSATSDYKEKMRKQHNMTVDKHSNGNTTVGMDIAGVRTSSTLDANKKPVSAKWKHKDFELDGKFEKGYDSATLKHDGGQMTGVQNKDGSGAGVAQTKNPWYKGGGYSTTSLTTGSDDVWHSPGPNQISKRIQMNDINEEVQYDAHGFATVHQDGKFYLIFNDEVVGKYDTIEELKDAHEHVINKIKLPEELEEEGTNTEWEIVINGNSYTTAVGETQEEAITNFWKANVEKEGIERFLGDMLYAQELKTNESVTESLDEEMEAMLRIAGLK